MAFLFLLGTRMTPTPLVSVPLDVPGLYPVDTWSFDVGGIQHGLLVVLDPLGPRILSTVM